MAIKSNIVIDQGADYITTLNVQDDNGTAIDLTGYSANAMIRKTYSSSNAVAFQISITPTVGQVALTLSANSSANMAPGRYVYDLNVVDTLLRKTRILEGILTINPSVTR